MRTTRWTRMAALLLCLGFLSAEIAAANGRHPLSGWTREEIEGALSLLRESGKLRDGTVLHSLSLAQPDKASVVGDSARPTRTARAVLTTGGETATIDVDLDGGAILSEAGLVGGRPPVSNVYVFAAIGGVLGDERVQAALRKRGMKNPQTAFCAPRTAGNFGEEEERNRRIVKLDCFDLADNPDNVFATPVEGLYVTYDLDASAILEIVETDVVPLPPGTHSLEAPEETRERKPVTIEAAAGRNFSEDDGWVDWENWRFLWRWDQRDGLVMGQVSYLDGETRRSILYEGHLSEIFVPYQDPTEGWYYRNYMDQGEYGLGSTASPLIRGVDCPESALYLSAETLDNTKATTLKDVLCIFERATGEPTWRHRDVLGSLEGRADVDLVVRYIATIGNYDYVFDWIFDAKGRITFRGGATGLDAVKGVASKDLSSATALQDTAWGPLIAEGRAGINHDHFFSLRLDLDVDGTSNRFVRDRLVAESQPGGSPRRSIWRPQRHVTQSEGEARYTLNYNTPSLFRIESTEKKNKLGYATSYVLQPGGNALPLVDSSDLPLQRARFAEHHVWVTAQSPEERYAAGAAPNQSEPNEGLPAFVADDEPLDGEDLVVWYTMGFHHIPSAEDWPVYSLGWHSVTLKPYNFFDQNPAMDLPAPKMQNTEATPAAGAN